MLKALTATLAILATVLWYERPIAGNALEPQTLPLREALELQCRTGDADACGDLGLGLQRGRWGEPDPGLAVLAYQEACDLGCAVACTNLGVLVEGDDVDLAEDAYARACAGADSYGCFNWGVLHARGAFGRPDYAKAVELFDLACGHGLKAGCRASAQLRAAKVSGVGSATGMSDDVR